MFSGREIVMIGPDFELYLDWIRSLMTLWQGITRPSMQCASEPVDSNLLKKKVSRT